MTATIRYEAEDGVQTIRRDEWHTDKDGFVTAYDNPDDEPGLFKTVCIPTSRVVTIRESNSTNK